MDDEKNRMLWTSTDIAHAVQRLETDFHTAPSRFFSEHDIHAHLHHIVQTSLNAKGATFIKCRNGQTAPVHLEYPTPFRCDMHGHTFKIRKDDERTPRGSLYRRGHYDLVILNPDYAEQYDVVTVSGKDHARLREARGSITASPLLWVCEVVFSAQVGATLPKNWTQYVFQDAKKVIATLGYPVGDGVPFASHGDVLVFFGYTSKRTTAAEEQIHEFSETHGFPIHFFRPQ
jgi:hypothetical protein